MWLMVCTGRRSSVAVVRKSLQRLRQGSGSLQWVGMEDSEPTPWMLASGLRHGQQDLASGKRFLFLFSSPVWFKGIGIGETSEWARQEAC